MATIKISSALNHKKFPCVKLILISILIFTFHHSYAQYPMAFVDDTFRDKSITLIKSCSDLHDVMFGDTLSSCRVPKGWKLVFYIDKNFCGESWTFTSDISNFKTYKGLNDNASSVMVYNNDQLQGYAIPCGYLGPPDRVKQLPDSGGK